MPSRVRADPQRRLEGEGMAGAALVAIRRHDRQLREVRECQGQGRQSLRLVAVVIAKQYLHKPRLTAPSGMNEPAIVSVATIS